MLYQTSGLCPYCEHSLENGEGGIINGMHAACHTDLNKELDAAFGPVEAKPYPMPAEEQARYTEAKANLEATIENNRRFDTAQTALKKWTKRRKGAKQS